jgi:hypothetical protein
MFQLSLRCHASCLCICFRGHTWWKAGPQLSHVGAVHGTTGERSRNKEGVQKGGHEMVRLKRYMLEVALYASLMRGSHALSGIPTRTRTGKRRPNGGSRILQKPTMSCQIHRCEHMFRTHSCAHMHTRGCPTSSQRRYATDLSMCVRMIRNAKSTTNSVRRA